MEPGELGEPVQEQECSAVPVSKDLPGAGEYASNGLFGLRFMGGTLVCSRVPSETER